MTLLSCICAYLIFVAIVCTLGERWHSMQQPYMPTARQRRQWRKERLVQPRRAK